MSSVTITYESNELNAFVVDIGFPIYISLDSTTFVDLKGNNSARIGLQIGSAVSSGVLPHIG